MPVRLWRRAGSRRSGADQGACREPLTQSPKGIALLAALLRRAPALHDDPGTAFDVLCVADGGLALADTDSRPSL
jgi:hypothetical protein